MFGDRTYDYTKEHKELDHNSKQGVFCPHCGKTLYDRIAELKAKQEGQK